MELKDKNTIPLPIPIGKGLRQLMREMEEEGKTVIYKELSLEELDKAIDKIRISVITDYYSPTINKIIEMEINKAIKYKLIKDAK